MVSLNATFLDDLGRVRLELVDPEPNVRYRIQRSTEDEPAWVPVRGAQNMSTVSATIVDDYEYTPNIENRYRLVAPGFYESFNRVFPTEGALSIDGASGSYANTPEDNSLDTANLDIRAEVTRDWDNVTGEQNIVSKYRDSTDDRSWRFSVVSGGVLEIRWSEDGTSGALVTLTGLQQVTTGTETRIAVRVTVDTTTGIVNFYTADSINGTWTLLESDTVSTPTNIFAGAADLEVGARDSGTQTVWNGLIHAVQVFDDIDGIPVADPDFTQEDPGTTSFIDSTGKTWTLHGNAEIIEIGPVSGSTWGTADTGQDWNLGTSSPGFGIWVDNGIGVIRSGDSPSGNIAEMVTDNIPGAEDAEIRYAVTTPDTSIDARAEFNLGLRATLFSDRYESRIFFDPNGDVLIRIDKFVGGVFGSLGTQIMVGTWSPGVFWNVRFRVVGSNLLMRAWPESHDEPVNWQVARNDADVTTGNAVYVRTRKDSGTAVTQWFGHMELHTIPQTVADIATVTPTQEEVFLKSIQYPLFNKLLECVDWQELTRESRVGFHNVKGRHKILGIADVGSSATFELTFITRSKAENRAVVALLTYGGLLLIQPPGDDESEECPVAYSGIPGGYVMPGESVQARTVYGKPIWQWTVEFTRVAAADAADIVPTTITWTQLWDLIGDEGTWQDVWDTWPTWQALWLTNGNPETFGDLEG